MNNGSYTTLKIHEDQILERMKGSNCKTNIKKKKKIKEEIRKQNIDFFFSIYFAGKLCLGSCIVTAQ